MAYHNCRNRALRTGRFVQTLVKVNKKNGCGCFDEFLNCFFDEIHSDHLLVDLYSILMSQFCNIEYSDLSFLDKCDGGSFGSVYKALWVSQNRTVAVKKVLAFNTEVIITALAIVPCRPTPINNNNYYIYIMSFLGQDFRLCQANKIHLNGGGYASVSALMGARDLCPSAKWKMWPSVPFPTKAQKT